VGKIEPDTLQDFDPSFSSDEILELARFYLEIGRSVNSPPPVKDKLKAIIQLCIFELAFRNRSLPVS